MILDALVVTSSCNANPLLVHLTNYTLSTVGTCQCLYVSHCLLRRVSGVKNLADHVVRLLWGELVGCRRGSRAPLLLPFGGMANSDNAPPNYKLKFCGGIFPARSYRSTAEWPLFCRYQREIEQVVLQQISLIHWCAGRGGSLWWLWNCSHDRPACEHRNLGHRWRFETA